MSLDGVMSVPTSAGAASTAASVSSVWMRRFWTVDLAMTAHLKWGGIRFVNAYDFCAA
jgi:hypothetical protein